MTDIPMTESTRDVRLARSIAQLGERWVLHPRYTPLPHHSVQVKSSHHLNAVRLKALQEGRLSA